MPFARRLSPSRAGSRAFTLLELIVVIVILGVLAGIAIPTFLTSQSKARDAVTSESLAATAHNAAALAALDQAFSDGNFSTAASESNLTALAPGLFAATAASAVAYNSSTGAGYASRPGVNGASSATAFTLSYQISPDKQSAGLAVVAPSGNCLMDVVSLTSNQKPWSFSNLGANCNGSTALAGPAQSPAYVAPGTPTIVTGFSATVASGTSVNLAWTAPTTGAASYLVTWTGGGSQSVPGTATSVQITGLTPNTSYTFTIVAQNVSSVAGPSASAGPVTTWSAALSSPSGLSASAGSNTVSLSWSAVTNAVSYNVYRGGTILASSATPSYTDTSAQNGTTYSYQVSSIDSHGQEGAPSAAVQAKPLPPVPGQVTGVTATAGNASVVVSWTTQSSAATYNVYQGATVIASVAAPTTTYTATGLTNGTSYSFQVQSVDSFTQTGTPSVAVSATPITTASAPTAVTASPGQSTMAVSWTAPASTGGSTISSYTVTISPAPTSGSATQSVSGTSTSFANLVSNTSYTVSVVAVNGAGSSAAATATSTTWNATPAAPASLTATAGNAQVALSWSAVTVTGGTIAKYNVYRGGTLLTTVTAPTTSYTDTTAANQTSYAYQVSAVDTYSQESAKSVAATAMPLNSFDSAVMSSGPVAYFPFNDTSGTVATNLVTSGSAWGNGTYNSGALINKTGYPTANGNTTRSVQTDSGVVALPSIPSTAFTNGMTVSAWVNWDGGNSAAFTHFIDWGTNTSNNIVVGRANNTSTSDLYVDAIGSGAARITAAGALPLNTWEYVTVTWATNGTVSVYVNGVLKGSSTGTTGPGGTARTTNTDGGSNWPDPKWAGYISNVSAYGSVLTQTTIQNQYTAR